MEYNIIINQAALRRWIEKGQVDADDAIIVAFIRGLHPDDPVVKRFMHGDFFRLHLGWLLQEMPVLKFTSDRLSRRLHALEKEGVVELLHVVDEKKQFKLYGRLSATYYREERKERERTGTTVGENTHGCLDRGCPSPTPWVKTPIDHKKDDHKRDRPAPLLTGEAGAAPREEEPDAADIAALIASLPWKKGSAAQ
jgi:hypothetical protein